MRVDHSCGIFVAKLEDFYLSLKINVCALISVYGQVLVDVSCVRVFDIFVYYFNYFTCTLMILLPTWFILNFYVLNLIYCIFYTYDYCQHTFL